MSFCGRKPGAWPIIEKIVLVLVVALVGVFAARILLFKMNIGGIRSRAYTKGHRITRTLAGFRALAIDVCWATHVSEDQPPTRMDLLRAFLYEHLPELMHLGDADMWEDQWGNPFVLVAKSPREYTFISAGPNGEHENGGGDDITYDFNPWEVHEGYDATENRNQ